MFKYFKSLFIVLSLTALSAPVLAKTLKIATIAPSGTTWFKEFKAAGKEITEQTDGRVKLKFFPGGIMGNDQSVLRKMRVGQLHGGALSGGALNKLYNGVQTYSLPFLFRNYGEVAHVRNLVDPVVKSELEKKGLVVLGISQGGFAHLFSENPIHNIDDLQTQKVWIPENDRITAHAFEKTGVNPIPLPIADVYTGLQTGLINTVGANPTSAIALQWHTKIKYMVEQPLLFIMGLMVVDKKVFDKLSSEDQAIVKHAVVKAFVKLDASNQIDDEQAKQAMLKSGVKVITLKDADFMEWQSIGKNAINELAIKNIYAVDLLKKVEASLHNYRTSNGN